MSSGLVCLLAILAVSNASVLFNLDPRIVNGEQVKSGEIPYQVSLQTRANHFCGGSVLNTNYVLTAAHCVFNRSPNTIEVVAGTINLDNRASVHQAEKIIVHKNYNPLNSWKNDIALIKVKTPFVKGPQVSYVPLPAPNEIIPPNSVATVSGWGTIKSGGQIPKNLLKAKIFIADQKFCENVYYDTYANIFPSQICAYDPSVEKGACNGDSGGPLTVSGKIVGIVSWSRGCALTDYPTVYTRVTSYLDWIKENAV